MPTDSVGVFPFALLGGHEGWEVRWSPKVGCFRADAAGSVWHSEGVVMVVAEGSPHGFSDADAQRECLVVV